MVICTVLLFAVAGGAVSAQAIVLDEASAVERALAGNLDLVRERVLLASSARTADTAWNALVPSVTLSGSLVRSNDEMIIQPPAEPYHTTLSAQLQAQLVLSLASIEGIRLARLQYWADLISYETASRRIARDVRKLFYQLILLERQVAVAGRSAATAAENLSRVESEFADGLVAEVAVRQAQIALQNRRLALQRQKAAYRDVLSRFRLLLHIDEEVLLELDGTIELEPTTDLDRIVRETGYVDYAELRSIEARILAQRSLTIARRRLARAPTLSLGASIQPGLADPFNPDNPANDRGNGWVDRGALSLTLSIPLDNHLPFSSGAVELQSQEALTRSLEIQREIVLDRARSDIASSVRGIENSRLAVESLRLGLDLAEELYRLMLDAYGNGAASFLDLLEAEDNRVEAHSDLLAEEYHSLAALIDLEYTLNRSLRTRKSSEE